MKHALICLGFVITIMTGVFYSTKTFAITPYLDNFTNSTSTSDHCMNLHTGFSCVPTDWPSSRDFWIEQPLNIFPATGIATTTIDTIEIYMNDCYFGNWEDSNMVLYDENGTGFATSTKNRFCQDGTREGFEITSYDFSASSPTFGEYRGISAFRIIGETGVSSPRETPVFKLEDDNYPENFGFTFQAEKYMSGGTDNGVLDQDMSFRINVEEGLLEILSPLDDWTVSGSLLTHGTCENNVNLRLSDWPTSSSSTVEFFDTVSCLNDTWSKNYGSSLPTDRYYLTATSTGEADAVSFLYLNEISTSTEEIGGLIDTFIDDVRDSFSCEIPFLSWNPCGALAYLLEAMNNTAEAIAIAIYNYFTNNKPYSYLTDTYTAFYNGLNNPTATLATSTISITSPYYSFDEEVFNADTFTQILDQDTWNNLRPFFSSIIWLLFAVYLFSVIKRISW